ncbi:MAG: 2-dehydro-3-deoxygalactonokinase, partial [Alphaproteobacteria bacterium]
MSSATDRAPPRGEAPALIGVDWGTSSCRAFLIDAAGRIIDRTANDQGILRVRNGAFAESLDGLIGAWRRPGLPVILSGMIGSRQGWIEAPYLPVPATFEAIAQGLLRHPEDGDIHIVPGLAQDLPNQAPDVMRGEETQIVGAVGAKPARRLLVMPGTHSKWVLVEDRRIVWFATFMTGELFAVLKDHSILGRLMTPEGGEEHAAFKQGLDAHRSLPGDLLQQLFSARTLGLFERLPGNALATYLSGLLIGHEIAEALGNLEAAPGQAPILVIGSSGLAERYRAALAHAGLETTAPDDDAAAHGHVALARVSGL